MAIDFEQINRAILVNYRSIITEWLPGGRLEGEQYVVRSPFREDKTPGSFKVNTTSGVFKDFADDSVSGADPINLYAMLKGMSQGDAARELSERYGGNYTPPPQTEKKTRAAWKIITPIPDSAPPPPREFYRKEFGLWKTYKISNYYLYKNIAGEPIGYTCRVNLDAGKKDIIPLTYATNGSETRWKFKTFERPRPLYGLHDLAKNPDAQVLIVEGEKCRDAAAKMLDGINVVPIAWVGGGKGVKYIDWKPISGRKCVFWPDADSQRYKRGHERSGEVMDFADQPGTTTMIQIYNLTKDKIDGARLLKPPEDWHNGKDVADVAGWSSEKLLQFISENLVSFDTVSQKPDASPMVDRPFQCLGYNSFQGNVTYYYLPKGTRKITALSANGHTKMNMLSIAPVTWFEREYTKSTGADFMAAANDCMRTCEHIGIYDPARIRGRGAWFDDGRTVLHLGDRLIVDGEQCKIDAIDSRYIYEAEIPTELSPDFIENYLDGDAARRVLDICKLLSWEHRTHAPLFAGWIMLSTVCGAIEWRPHIWLTGESSSGKSWTLENVVSPILGKTLLSPMSNSTEAGVRQLLKNDAFPIRFDEIETEDRLAADRVQRIIELARQSSSNQSGTIVKGTTTGKALSYCIRSCFLFSSINPRLIQQADESRIKILNLVRRADYQSGSKFEDLQNLVLETLTEEYCQKFRARAIRMIPYIRENASIFSRLASVILKSKRGGDQIGTLLAGAYNIKHDDVVDEADAGDYIRSFDWETELKATPKADQSKCLDTILQALIINESKNSESIGSLIRKAGQPEPPHYATSETVVNIERDRRIARRTLRKYGITTILNKESGGYDIGFCANHSQLKKLLNETPWQDGYKLILARLEGAEKRSAVFGQGQRAQAVVIPYSNIIDENAIDTDEPVDPVVQGEIF